MVAGLDSLTRREFLKAGGAAFAFSLISANALGAAERKSRIYFTEGKGDKSEVYSMEEGGGNIERLTDNDFEEVAPKVSPNNQWLIYAKRKPTTRQRFHQVDDTDIQILDIASGKTTVLEPTEKDLGCWSSITRFEWHPVKPRFAAHTINPNYDAVEFGYDSASGKIILVPQTGFPSEGVGRAVFSPNGEHIAYFSWCWTERGLHLDHKLILPSSHWEGNRQIIDKEYKDPVWSPQGDRLFARVRGDGLYVMKPDGGSIENLVSGKDYSDTLPPVCSPDGKRLAFVDENDRRIRVVDTESRKVTNLRESLPRNRLFIGFVAEDPEIFWSSDGEYLFSRGNHKGDADCIYRIKADGTDLKIIRKGVNRLIGYQ